MNRWNKPNDLISSFYHNSTRRRLDDSNNGIKLFEKIRSGEMKLEEAAKCV